MFSAQSGTGSNAYQNVGVESIAEAAAPHQLVHMLFNGARAAVAEAKGHLDRNEVAAKGGAISKAISIIDGGLKASLDLNVGGEMAKNLSDLYVYMVQRLVYANLKNDRAAMDEVAKLLHELGDAWGSIAGAKRATAPATKAAQDARPEQANRAAAAQERELRARTAAPTPMYGATAAPARTRQVTTAPEQTQAPSPDPVHSNRPAVALAQAYGAASVRPQTEHVPAAAPSGRPNGAAPEGPVAPASNAAPANPSSQQSRLAAAYGVR